MVATPPSPATASMSASEHAPSSTRQNTTTQSTSTASSGMSFNERVLEAEHRFTTLTQNIAHFSPLKTQLDKHNLAIERLENEVKKKTAVLQACQDKLQSAAKRPSTSRHGSRINLYGSDEGESELLLAQHQSAKEAVEHLNGQLLAAKILVS
ncbi:hypothetical protein BGZ94_004422 [Podila epigama]|nr:hypothetical protein BGZ94_004422 [Podila epigama]